MDDTIAAISTPYGEGGIGIIRMSGSLAGPILSELFVPVAQIEANNSGPTANDSGADAKIENRKLRYGKIIDHHNGQILDEVLVAFMKGPYTYTREDVAEIYCHGSVVALRNILKLALHHGARLAEAGEFTKRAFLNGRLDLSQAEAVIDMIQAKTEKGFEVAVGQLEGKLSQKIQELRASLLNVLVDMTVNIDYPDQDIEEILYDNLIKSISQIGETIRKLMDSADAGRILKEGLRVAIIGKPNVGKSSLMNALLGETRAIVTDIPGTTRDTISETISIKGIPICITDTAGIHETDNEIEQIGIARSKISFNQADLVLFMVSENKIYAHPASVDSIPSSGNQEDHVSMGTTAARTAAMILDNAQKVLGIELFAASQAIWLRGETGLSPATKAAYEYIRRTVDPIDHDVLMHDELVKFDEMVKDNSLVEVVEKVTGGLK